jgi:hypothetical protein
MTSCWIWNTKILVINPWNELIDLKSISLLANIKYSDKIQTVKFDKLFDI